MICGDLIVILQEFNVSGKKTNGKKHPGSAYLHPLAVASQVEEAEVLVLEYEPPIENGPYPTYALAELEEVEKWDWISEVSPVISSTTFAARRNAGKRVRDKRVVTRWSEKMGGIQVGYIGNISYRCSNCSRDNFSSSSATKSFSGSMSFARMFGPGLML